MATHGDKQLESEFRAWVCKKIHAMGWFVQTIETTTKSGVPDLYAVTHNNASSKSVAFWLELKVGCSKTPLIRKEQRVWGKLHKDKGGRSYFLYYNYGTGKLHVYANPVEEVAMCGKYLALLDPPVRTVNREELQEMLQEFLIF